MPSSVYEAFKKERTLTEVSSQLNAWGITVHHQQKARAKTCHLELCLGVDTVISKYASVSSQFQRMPGFYFSDDYFLWDNHLPHDRKSSLESVFRITLAFRVWLAVSTLRACLSSLQTLQSLGGTLSLSPTSCRRYQLNQSDRRGSLDRAWSNPYWRQLKDSQELNQSTSRRKSSIKNKGWMDHRVKTILWKVWWFCDASCIALGYFDTDWTQTLIWLM